MDGATGGLMGGVGGTVLGFLGAYVGARESKGAAINVAQQRFYRRVFDLTVAFAVVLLAIVSLAASGILPYLVYIAAMIVWFMLLGPAIFWTNRCLQKLQIQTQSLDEYRFRRKTACAPIWKASRRTTNTADMSG